MSEPLPLAILLSGNGTTLQNLLDHIRTDRLAARVVCVVSSRADAYGVERARQAGIPTQVVERRAFATRQEFSTRILASCQEAGARLIAMAGFLQFLDIPADLEHRVMNIHPALLPAFGGKGYHGLRVHQAALDLGVKVSGCTVHFADNEYDHGPIILQRPVPVEDDDTPESLQARVFAAECQAYPEAIALFAANRLQILGRRVRILREGRNSQG